MGALNNWRANGRCLNPLRRQLCTSGLRGDNSHFYEQGSARVSRVAVSRSGPGQLKRVSSRVSTKLFPSLVGN
jgi:hypothetical protein